ncbi:unnamed protein product [Rhizophagus irregularis]|nr:unnamed protein product [Rhizophagus irregularis]
MTSNNDISKDDENFLKEFLKNFYINDISKDDENLLKEFLKGFYRKIIKIKNYDEYEIILIEWIKEFLNFNKKNSKIILELMINHENNEIWFSSLIGFFYQYNIDNTYIIDNYESLKLYSNTSNINYKEKYLNFFSVYQILNIIISKYLLSFYYYKDIICKKRNLYEKELKQLGIINVMSRSLYENFNGLKIDICNDEINNIENYFELLDKGFKNQSEYTKDKKLVELNNLAYSQNEFKTFESYLKSSKEGNSCAQNNLGYCYQYGIGIEKDDIEAFKYYLKAAKGGSSDAENNLGDCYKNGIGISKDENKAFEWYAKAAKGGNSDAENNLSICYINGIGTEINLEKAIYWCNKAAENGNGASQYSLGVCYEIGIVVKKDEDKTLEWNAKEGNTIEIKKDLEKAMYWYNKAAESGNEIAQYKLEN